MSKRRRAPAKPHKSTKPKALSRTQAFLVELKTTIQLLRDVLLEVKELLVVVTLIVFFLLGVWETLGPKVVPRFHATASAHQPP